MSNIPSGGSNDSPPFFRRTLQILMCVFACFTGQSRAKGLREFDVTWSGVPFNNSAFAKARITFDPSSLQPSITDGTDWVGEFTITVSGAADGNGTWTKQDFGDIQIRTGDDPLDFTRELVGQYGFGSQFEPFKAFKFAGPTVGAPQSEGQFIIRCGGNFGPLLSLTSFRPAAGSSRLELQSAFNGDPRTGEGVRSGQIYALAEDSRGRLIAGGISDYASSLIARFLPSGEIDRTFYGDRWKGKVTDLVVLPDDSIVAAGDLRITHEGISRATGIMKTLSNGRIDPSFASGSGADATIRSIKRQTDGKFIIGGEFTQYDGIPRNKLARLMPDGSLDPSFLTANGFGSATDYVDKIQLLEGGLVMIAGRFSSYAGHSTRNVARLLSDGNVDTTFRSTLPTNSTETMRVLSSGKILVGDNQRLFCLHSDGTVDTGFNPTFTGSVYGALELPGGRTMVSGLISSPEGEGFSNLMVLNPDGSVDANAFHAKITPNGPVGPLLAGAQGNFYIGGAFSAINGQAYGRLAKLADFSADFQFESATETIMEGSYKSFFVTLNDSLTAPAEFQITTEADYPGVLPMIFVHPSNYAYPGQMKTEIHVGFADDSEINGPRTFRLKMTSLTVGASVGTPDIMRIRVEDNDVPATPPFRVWAGDEPLLNGGKPPVNIQATLVGETSTKTFTLTNDDFSNLNLAPIILSLGNTEEFLIGAPASMTVAPGGSTTFDVTFAPKTSGTKTAAILVFGTGPRDVPFDISLAGIAITPAPEIVVEQTAGRSLTSGKTKISFGTARVGQTDTTRTFTIKNTGTAPLTDITFSKQGKHPKDFVITHPSQTSLAPGASLTFKAKFKPRGLQTRSASIRIRSNDKDENPFNIELTGFGTFR